MGNSLVQALRYSGPLNWESTNTKIKCEETGERRGGGACNHFFKQPIPLYQLLVYPVICQICQIISTLSKQVVPVAQKDGMQHPRTWNSGIHYNFCVEQMFTRFPTHRSAEEGTEDFPCELGVWKKFFLPFCCLALVLHDNKVATTEQSQEGVIYTLQSRLTLPQDLFRRTSLRKQRPQWQRARRNGCFRRLWQFYSQKMIIWNAPKWAEEGRKRNDYNLRAWNRLGRKGYGHLHLVKQRQPKSQ